MSKHFSSYVTAVDVIFDQRCSQHCAVGVISVLGSRRIDKTTRLFSDSDVSLIRCCLGNDAKLVSFPFSH